MKSDYFYPHIGDRRTPRDWESDGSNTVGDRARDVARQLIAEHFPTRLNEATDIALRAAFDIKLPREVMGKSR